MQSTQENALLALLREAFPEKLSLRVSKAAKVTDVAPTTIYREMREGRIPSIKTTTGVLIDLRKHPASTAA